MDTSEIQNSLKYKLGDKIEYLGVFTSDHITNIKINKYRIKVVGFICNTLESTDSATIMGHWVAFAIDKSPNDRIIFFDSYGFDPRLYAKGFRRFIDNNRNFKLFSFDRQYQLDTSYKCGLYTIFFIHNISLEGLRQTIIKIRSNLKQGNGHQNDEFVSRYYLKHITSGNCQQWRNKNGKTAFTYQECKNLLNR